jgi:hypothetical protein
VTATPPRPVPPPAVLWRLVPPDLRPSLPQSCRVRGHAAPGLLCRVGPDEPLRWLIVVPRDDGADLAVRLYEVRRAGTVRLASGTATVAALPAMLRALAARLAPTVEPRPEPVKSAPNRLAYWGV